MDKREAWEYALGLLKIDNIEPSLEFLELIEKEIAGEITTADIREILDKKYKADRKKWNEREG